MILRVWSFHQFLEKETRVLKNDSDIFEVFDIVLNLKITE